MKHMQGLFLAQKFKSYGTTHARPISSVEQLANLFTGSLLDEIVVNGCILQDTEENLCEQIFNNWKKPNATDIRST